jgi:hypothetical protein
VSLLTLESKYPKSISAEFKFPMVAAGRWEILGLNLRGVSPLRSRQCPRPVTIILFAGLPIPL